MQTPLINPAATPRVYPLSNSASEWQVLSNKRPRSLIKLRSTAAGPGISGRAIVIRSLAGEREVSPALFAQRLVESLSHSHPLYFTRAFSISKPQQRWSLSIISRHRSRRWRNSLFDRHRTLIQTGAIGIGQVRGFLVWLIKHLARATRKST